ncbi:hypothetical protein CRV24_003365 [Beauveria bassiana]|nr:hypothetical protein CRV24_003365 [Beauveria bassiana]
MASFQLGWESYADTQLNSKPEISEKVHLILPKLQRQCPRLANLSLTFNNFFMEDIPLPAFQPDPGIRLCCLIQNLKRLSITDSAGEELDGEVAMKWFKEEILGG